MARWRALSVLMAVLLPLRLVAAEVLAVGDIGCGNGQWERLKAHLFENAGVAVRAVCENVKSPDNSFAELLETKRSYAGVIAHLGTFFNASPYTRLLPYLTKAAENGKNVAIILAPRSLAQPEFNEPLRDQFGASVIFSPMKVGTGSIQAEGPQLLPIWQDLRLGITDTGIQTSVGLQVCGYISVTKEWKVQRMRASTGQEHAMAAWKDFGQGRILLLTPPFCFLTGNGVSHSLPFFYDRSLELFDNREAATRLFKWLAGAQALQ